MEKLTELVNKPAVSVIPTVLDALREVAKSSVVTIEKETPLTMNLFRATTGNIGHSASLCRKIIRIIQDTSEHGANTNKIIRILPRGAYPKNYVSQSG